MGVRLYGAICHSFRQTSMSVGSGTLVSGGDQVAGHLGKGLIRLDAGLHPKGPKPAAVVGRTRPSRASFTQCCEVTLDPPLPLCGTAAAVN